MNFGLASASVLKCDGDAEFVREKRRSRNRRRFSISPRQLRSIDALVVPECSPR